MGMYRTFCVLIVTYMFTFSPSDGQQKDGLRTEYMNKYCRLVLFQYILDNEMVPVETSMVLNLARNASFNKQLTCIATFTAQNPQERLLLHFESLYIDYRQGTNDRLRIYDGGDCKKQLTGEHGLYGKYTKGKHELSSGGIHDYVSSGQSLTLYFVGTPTKDFPGFKALLTVIKDSGANGTCPNTYMKCRMNKYCVSRSLLCNGHQICGLNDPTGMEDCDTDTPMGDYLFSSSTDLGLMVGCAISIFILMVVVMWLGIVCIKRARFKDMWRRRRLSSSLDEAIVNAAQQEDLMRAISPPPNFLEPPPAYSETAEAPENLSSSTNVTSCFELPPPYAAEDTSDTLRLLQTETTPTNTAVDRLVENLTRTITCSDPHQGFSMANDILIEHGTTVGRTEPRSPEDDDGTSEMDNLVLAEEAKEEDASTVALETTNMQTRCSTAQI